jgi:hypothetical protein
MARRPQESWRGSRYEKQSGRRTPLTLESILDESGHAVDAALSKTNPTLSQTDCLLRHAGCHALHASDRRLRPATRTFPSAALPG